MKISEKSGFNYKLKPDFFLFFFVFYFNFGLTKNNIGNIIDKSYIFE